MKKKTVKALSRLAQILPPAYLVRDHTEGVTLRDIYEIREKEGEDTDDLPDPSVLEYGYDTIYRVKSEGLDKINHLRRLKKAWKDEGTKGVQTYILWVDQHTRRYDPRIESLLNSPPPKVDDRLVDIAKANVSFFWKSLISFLLSFYHSFLATSEEE